MTVFSDECSSCKKEIPSGERYHALDLHQEVVEGGSVTVHDAQALFYWCQACAAKLDFDAVSVPRKQIRK